MKKSKKRKCIKKLELRERLKNNKAITLIALIVTIIVLLILAGVSIATLTGDNGLLTKAQEAKEENEKASDRDLIAMAVSEAQIGNSGYQELDETNFQKALENQFKERRVEVIDNGDGSFNINLDNGSNMYYIDNDRQIIDKEDMIAIETAEELKAFRDDVNNGNTYEGKYVYLTDNIQLDINEEWEPIGTYLTSNTSIDDETNIPFSGIFDGKGFEINGIKITSKDKGKGLFGLVKFATIKNVGIGENCNINAGVVVGGIVGYANSETIIEKCYNKSTINSYSNQVGGIVGQNGANCYIISCYNLATIKGASEVGGIVGINYGTIDKCYNSGDINSDTTNVGGIAGVNDAIVNNCYNINTINGTGTNIGGIVGLQNSDNAKISNSYNIGNILGTGNGFGIAFLQKGTLENTYFLENTVNGANGHVYNGSTPKTSEELKSIAIILGSAYKEDISNKNNGYPILQWQ